MNNYQLEELADSRMIPQLAIIVHHNKRKEEYYLEMRKIDQKGRMGAATPLSEQCITEIAQTFSHQAAIRFPYGNIPSQLLYADARMGRERYIWYNPPRRRMMYFSKSLGIPDGEYAVPGILYLTSGSTLKVFAFKGKKCTRDTALYRAPYFNVYSDHSVCKGNYKLTLPDDLTYEGYMRHWETVFWQTKFTQIHGGNPVKGNLVKIMLDSNERFNPDVLIPLQRNGLKKVTLTDSLL